MGFYYFLEAFNFSIRVFLLGVGIFYLAKYFKFDKSSFLKSLFLSFLLEAFGHLISWSLVSFSKILKIKVTMTLVHAIHVLQPLVLLSALFILFLRFYGQPGKYAVGYALIIVALMSFLAWLSPALLSLLSFAIQVLAVNLGFGKM